MEVELTMRFAFFHVCQYMQEIASHGCFSLGMVARFESTLREKNTWMYPRLFWETGVLGQVLYLEAHAVGISATGIGCYFDDPGKLLLLTVILSEGSQFSCDCS